MRSNNLKIARLVTSPDEFNVAVAQPKATWGEQRRSLRLVSGAGGIAAHAGNPSASGSFPPRP